MKKLFLLIIPVFVVVFALITADVAHAAFGRQDLYGYFDNRYQASGMANYGGIFPNGGISSGDASSFISYIQGKLDGGGRDAVGASFIVQTMLGLSGGSGTTKNLGSGDARFTDWVNRVRDRDSHGHIAWNRNMSYNINSGLQKLVPGYDAATWTEAGSSGAAIIFYDDSNNIVYAIKRDCGNPIGNGSISSLPPVVIQPPTSASLGISVNGYNGSVSMSLGNSSDGGPHDVGNCTNRGGGITSFTVDGYRECPGQKIGPIAIVTPAISNYAFTGWSGCDNVSGSTCYMEQYSSGTKYITASYRASDQYAPSFAVSADCQNVRVFNIDDSDYSGGAMTFDISIGGNSLGSFSGSWSGEINFPTPADYKNASSYTVSATTSGLTPNGDPGTNTVTQTAQFGPCDPNPPSFNLAATCDSIDVTGLTDPDNGGNVPLVITVDGTQVYSGNTRGNVHVNFPGDKQDADNHTVTADATSIMLDGSPNPYLRTTRSVVVTSCYRAACTVRTDLAPINIDTNDAIKALADITNTGYFPWNGNNSRITTRLNYNGSTASPNIPATAPGGSINGLAYSGFNVPNSVANQSMTVEILLDGNKSIGTCNVAFDPYTKFVVQPSVSSSGFAPSDENPTSYSFASNATLTYVSSPDSTPATLDGGMTFTRIIQKTAPGGPPINVAFGPVGTTFTSADAVTSYSIAAYNLGDKYCPVISMNYTKGRANRLGNVVDLSTPANPASNCSTVAAYPIVRAYGGDVAAGFSACTGWNNTASAFGDIIAWVKDAVGGGSGTSLASFGKGKTVDFSTGLGKTAPNGPPLFLTFASTDKINMPFGAGACPFDYWSAANGNIPVTTDVTALGAGTFKTAGSTTISASGAMNGTKTIYVDGDAYVTNSVQYDQSSNWTLDTLPSFSLIVHGNIYISPSVTNLDGLYVAQPVRQANGSYTGGEIRTCVQDASGKSPADSTIPSFYERCKTNLTVTGAFVAKTIRLQRTKGSRKDSNNADNAAAALNNTGEIFIFSPEIWLRSPALGNSKQYDSITALPPVL